MIALKTIIIAIKAIILHTFRVQVRIAEDTLVPTAYIAWQFAFLGLSAGAVSGALSPKLCNLNAEPKKTTTTTLNPKPSALPPLSNWIISII